MTRVAWLIAPPYAQTPWVTGGTPLGEVLTELGPIKEAGVNGLTGEALLAILIDRLRSFQAGPYACQQNATALWHLREALDMLQVRTRARIARGVEGTHQA